MKGSDWAVWRKRLGYSTAAIMRELGVSSRQTINNWEHADKVPRLAELALYALENFPQCREVVGKGVTKTEGRRYFAQRG
jgi:transcriptional regulator with XRE-family HTH domain